MPAELESNATVTTPEASAPVSAPSSSPAPVSSGAGGSETPLSAGPFGSSNTPASQSVQPSPVSGSDASSFAAANPALAGGAVEPGASPVTGGQPQVDPWVQQLQALGFENLSDPAEAQRRVVEAIQLRNQQLAHWQGQAQQMEQYARAYAQLQQDPRWQAFQQQQVPQQAQAAQAQAAAEHVWWKAPQVDLGLLEQYREEQVDPLTGQKKLAWKPETPVEYRQNVEAYTRHLKQWQDDLVTRPHEVLPKIIEAEVMPLVERMFQQREQQQQTQQFVQQVNENNADWLYARDPVTNQFLVDHQGQRVMSNEGQHVAQYISEASSIGIQDPAKRWQYATMAYERDLLRYQAQSRSTATNAVQQHEQQKLQHLQAAAAQAVPNRGGSLTPNQPPTTPIQPTRRKSAGERLMEQFRANGVQEFSPLG